MINLGPTLQLKPYCELVLSFVLKQHYTFTLIKKNLFSLNKENTLKMFLGSTRSLE
jgi:hypothetical protein